MQTEGITEKSDNTEDESQSEISPNLSHLPKPLSQKFLVKNPNISNPLLNFVSSNDKSELPSGINQMKNVTRNVPHSSTEKLQRVSSEEKQDMDS